MNKLIKNFVQNARDKNVAVDSIVVEENGVVEEKVLNKTGLHQIRSCSKLLVCFAYGIAIDEKFVCKDGKVLTLQSKVYDTFAKISNPPEQVKEWTIRTLLTHSTGYEKMLFNEKHIANLNKFHLLDTLFATPIKYKTDTHFTYSNVEPYLLSVFFKENFGQNISDFINDRILKPMKINRFIWEDFGDYCAGATGSFFDYKDFHKFGELLLNFGNFNGKQIVPKWWVEEMIKPQVECSDYYKPERVLPKLHAGYFTWVSRDGIVFRDGSDGQYIICDYKNNRLLTIMSSQLDMYMVSESLRGLI